MSVEETIKKLKQLIHARPAFKHVVLLTVKNKQLTLVDALEHLEKKKDVATILAALQSEGLNRGNSLAQLAEDYYRRLAEVNPNLRLYSFAFELSAAEAVEEIRASSEVGVKLTEAYGLLLNELKSRMRVG